MRVKCPDCGKSMVVTNRHNLIPNVDDLYCQCRCGTRAVYTLSLKHTLETPTATAKVVMTLLNALPEEERAKIRLEQLEMFAPA
jgi:hypothetical protein